ncbi:LLM class flavin-dependent oxidoreductase [Rhizorhabdus dicambivorans]|uniref:LLM class flavin-dependent oxidoreductase n=1 Tax=Rhizorhabdus dicambivorans TaxID=1850238 RepID=A0A2A4FUL0_9SPHN|nr:LLM class flavin-dependent oxidoreductase [Rhizorhabdus dicambivorans]ATE65485.1 LLM class flavin-dependent oxidoreductase [Rhizorhabdus dicambivorans]PCE41829.1 LLM class flavin-dependent oxidoreductase [Rhizorhabdus dicambivorans]
MVKSWAFEFIPAREGFTKSYDVDDTALRNEKGMAPDEGAAYFEFYLNLWSRAEELGFYGIFQSEHHFGRGYSPSPNLLIAAMSQRTKNLRIGAMGMVVPFNNPWRIVEEIGMLDNLTGGRLEIGTSAGIPHELESAGMSPAEGRERYEEALQIIDAGIRQPIISHSGKYWNFHDLRLVPRPVQQPHPPMWTTVISIESARKAARRGSKITTAFAQNEQIRELFDAYNEEAAKHGHPTGPEQVGLRRQIIIDESELVSTSRSEKLQDELHKMVAKTDKRYVAPGQKAFDAPSGGHGFTIGEDEYISGTPAQVREQVLEQCERTGAGHFLSIFGGCDDLDQLTRSWELYAVEVNPALARA